MLITRDKHCKKSKSIVLKESRRCVGSWFLRFFNWYCVFKLQHKLLSFFQIKIQMIHSSQGSALYKRSLAVRFSNKKSRYKGVHLLVTHRIE